MILSRCYSVSSRAQTKGQRPSDSYIFWIQVTCQVVAVLGSTEGTGVPRYVRWARLNDGPPAVNALQCLSASIVPAYALLQRAAPSAISPSRVCPPSPLTDCCYAIMHLVTSAQFASAGCFVLYAVARIFASRL